VNTNNVVNPKSKTYGKGVTYNGNAFVQQLNLVVNTASTDPKFNPWDPKAKPNPDSKYTKASLAALSFGKAVSTTGNTNKQVTELTSEQVYKQVDKFDQEPPQSSVPELQNVLKQGMSGAGADEANENGWVILDEEQRNMVRLWVHSNIREKANAKKIVSEPLWSGSCHASIRGVEVSLDIMMNPETRELDIKNTSILLPVFEFEITDSTWTGKIAEVVRERLSQIYFVKSLIHQQVEAGLKSLLQVSVLNVLKNA
jgi:hypothetical protein